MDGRCPGSCLYHILVGAAPPAPPRTPQDVVCEHELWLEAEVARLQREAWRLYDLNDHLKQELFWQESQPKRTKSKLVDIMDAMPQAEPSEDGTEDSYAPTTSGMNRRMLASQRKSFETDVDHDLLQLPSRQKSLSSFLNRNVNAMVVKSSALSMTRGAQALIYSIAFAFVIFVLVATATHLGAAPECVGGECHKGHEEVLGAQIDGDLGHHAADHGAHVRRLGGGVAPLIKYVAVTLVVSGLCAMAAHTVKQPLILGYLAGGVLVGPNVLNIVESHVALSEMTHLGLIFLLFMIGLELDVKALVFKMGKVACLTGLVQLPLCSAIMAGIFVGLEAAGVSFGPGQYAALYCGVTAGFSSTMMVVKLLGQKSEADSMAGRMTMGILICQDIWAIAVLALQVNLSHPTAVGIVKTFAWLFALIAFALGYAKFVMPAALYYASKSVELMLVLSLAWCFFICVVAGLPFVGLPMEVAALVAGIALATFPYSAEFNAKIKYIRDFFFTLFFAGMGMMLPLPRPRDVLACVLMSVMLVAFRWVGCYLPCMLFGGVSRVATIATINISQIGEFALVICSLGVRHGHIDEETLEIVIFTFALTAIATSLMIRNNFALYKRGAAFLAKLRGGEAEAAEAIGRAESGEDDRDIVLVGFYKIAFMLFAEFETKTPELLKAFHVVDFNKTVLAKLANLGIKCTVGDIASAEVWSRSQTSPPRIVISTIPDTLLQGINNEGIVKLSRQVWPTAKVIVTADSPHQAKELYTAGADYVLRMAKLSAERLHELLSEHGQGAFEHSQLQELFSSYKSSDASLNTNYLDEKLFAS